MAWTDRLREAAYTSPSGKRLTFTYENVRTTVDKRTSGFDFPDVDGTYVQDLGRSGRKYPLRIFFWGDDYDLEADAFDAALMERGAGTLEHPLYGNVTVVPFGTISRRDDLKTAANQAIMEIVFWETTNVIYPSAQGDPASMVLAAVAEYNNAVAEEFEEVTELDSAVSIANFKNRYSALVDGTRSNLQSIADVKEDVRRQFNAIVDSITTGLDVLVTQPRTLAAQTVLFIQSAARAIPNVQGLDVSALASSFTTATPRLSAYDELARGVIDDVDQDVTSNAFHTSDLYTSTYVTGTIISVINNRFVTKSQAIEAADFILTLMSDVTDWRDGNFETLSEIDTGASYQKLQDAVALTAGFLVEISFSLKQERSVVIDRPRTIVDLTAELYGVVDSELDFLINSNDLSGIEILEMQKGREIVYYV